MCVRECGVCGCECVSVSECDNECVGVSVVVYVILSVRL